MTKIEVADGVAHKLPADMKKALIANPKSLVAWQNITPLARNEWICWTISVKQEETRKNHVKRTVTELAQGKRRPCCWMGCPHRKDKQISRSVKWVLSRQAKA